MGDRNRFFSSIDARDQFCPRRATLPGPVGFLRIRSVLNSNVDLGLCRELTVRHGHVKEQVLPSLGTRSKKCRLNPWTSTVRSLRYVHDRSSPDPEGKKMTIYARALPSSKRPELDYLDFRRVTTTVHVLPQQNTLIDSI